MKRVSLLIVLLAIMFGCSKEEKPNTKQKNVPSISQIKNKPIEWLKESIDIQNFRNSFFSYSRYYPKIEIKNISIDKGIIDIQLCSNNPQLSLLQNKILCTEMDFILVHLFHMSKEIDIDSVNISSFSRTGLLLKKSCYNKEELIKIFQKIEADKKYSVLKESVSFNKNILDN